MRFVRRLKEEFVDELNSLYAIQDSWWHKMVEDKKAFILIRNNKLRIQASGGLLLQVEMDAQGGFKCQSQEEFLSLRSETNPYVQLTEDKTTAIKRVEGLKSLAEHYEQIKRRIKLFSEKEKKVVQDIGANNKQIVDLEIGLEGELKPDAARKGAQRVDMATVSNEGVLVFFEVKLFDNSEIRSESDKTPAVVGQLKKYQNLLQTFGTEIENGYKDQFKVYEQLKGHFFSQKRRSIGELPIYPTVRLVVTEFDGSQQKYLLPVIKERINKGMGWQDKNSDLITVGDHKNIRMELLLKGIS
jgi:hypothetical protein